jgi:C4-type Zn-finger protein
MSPFFALTTVLALVAHASAEKVTPVGKVLAMLGEMKVKGEKMMEEEQKTQAAYAEWVDDRTREMGFEIKTAESTIEELIAFIDKADSDVAKLGDEIASLDGDIARLEGESADATKIRNSEKAEFLNVEQDYSESVDALKRAIQVVSTQQYARPQAMMLLQKMAKTAPSMQRVLAAFEQQQDRTSQDGAPAVAAYTSQGGGVVAMLEGLLEKFKEELSSTQEEESNKAHDYDLTMIHLRDTIAKCNVDRDEKAAAKASTAAASAKAKGELADTKASLAETQTVLRDMKAEFKSKTATYEENQKVRAGELEAIAKATEIMSSPEVAGSYKKRINLAQVSPASFLQMSTARQMSLQQKAAAFLQKRAGASHSATLARLSAQIMASPFAKVIDMIEGLLAKLKSEAAAEADHKAWCDEQLKENKLKRNKKTAHVERLTAEVQELTSTIETMGQNIDTLLREQSELTTAMRDATSFRDAEKKENLAIIADAKAGHGAVQAALVILREFYAKQAALLQQAPEIEEYKGMGGAKGGVVGMLEVIETDFARLDADTTAAEKQAASEYDTFMTDAQADKKQKHELEVKTKLDKDQTEFEKSQTQKDLVAVEEELAKANEYYAYLKPSCLEVKVSYEERVAARKEELASLNEAYDILDEKA